MRAPSVQVVVVSDGGDVGELAKVLLSSSAGYGGSPKVARFDNMRAWGCQVWESAGQGPGASTLWFSGAVHGAVTHNQLTPTHTHHNSTGLTPVHGAEAFFCDLFL